MTVWGQLDVSDAAGGPWCRHRGNFCGPHSSKDRCFPGESIRPCRPQESGLLIDNWLAEAFLGPSGCQVDLGALKWKPSVPAQNQVLYQPVPNHRSLRRRGPCRGGVKTDSFLKVFQPEGCEEWEVGSLVCWEFQFSRANEWGGFGAYAATNLKTTKFLQVSENILGFQILNQQLILMIIR